jgi:hypothetical protein
MLSMKRLFASAFVAAGVCAILPACITDEQQIVMNQAAKDALAAAKPGLKDALTNAASAIAKDATSTETTTETTDAAQ